MLITGRIEQYKNIQHIIRTMPYLPADYYLQIAGKGSYRGSLEKLSKEIGAEDRIRFLGYVADANYPEVLANASIFIQSSNIESFGLSCIEALAMGVKCVVNAHAYGLLELSKIFGKDVNAIPMDNNTLIQTADLIQKIVHLPISINKKDLKPFDWNNVAKKFEKYLLQQVTDN